MTTGYGLLRMLNSSFNKACLKHYDKYYFEMDNFNILKRAVFLSNNQQGIIKK